MRAVIYARYSTELQREASIDDQVRICTRRIEREGWESSQVYSDRGTSGASNLRPGYQQLLEDARNGRFEVVVAESLDRCRATRSISRSYLSISRSGTLHSSPLPKGKSTSCTSASKAR